MRIAHPSSVVGLRTIFLPECNVGLNNREASGFGHELGREGLDEFLDVKAISVAPAS